MARPKTHARPVAVAKLQFKEAEEKECPLCIEQLDDTDRDFYPCSCGYQVCLFCYQRLQNEYNNTCPGCRQQYSDDLDAVRQHIERKRQQAAAEATTKSALAGSHGHGHGGHAHGHGHGHAHGHGHGHPPGHAQHGAPGHRGKQSATAAAAAAAAASTAKQRAALQQQNEAGHVLQCRLAGQQEQPQGLPASANWVSASSLHSLSSVDDSPPAAAPAPPADETAWPTLGAVAASSAQQPKLQQHHEVRRRSSGSGSMSSMHSQQQQQQQPPPPSSRRHDPSRSSCDSIMSTGTEVQLQLKAQHGLVQQLSSEDDDDQHQQEEEQQEPQEQQCLEHRSNSSGFTTVEVTTFVGGTRHSVCVPVTNHSDVPAFPEAATLLEMLQQAVNGNKLSSTEAAVQLVQCLRKLEADSNQKQRNTWLQQALSSGQSGRGHGLNGTLHRQPSAGAGRPPTAPNAAGGAARAPPPGFANVAPKNNAQYVSQLQSQELAAAAAAARGMPYRPVSSGQLHQQAGADAASNNYASQSSMHSVDSNSSLFSQGSSLSQSLMWTEGGLPGLDFGGSAVAGLTSGLPAVPPRLQMLWAGSNGADNSVPGSASQPPPAPAAGAANGFGAPTPPPGFGLSLSGAGAGLSGSRLQSSYNPLAAGGGLGGEPAGWAFQQHAAQQQAMYRPWA